MSRLLLLDRDGTLMRDVSYPRDPDRVELIPGAADAVRALAAAGFVPAVVSNQSGLARGIITPAEAIAVHDRFVSLFRAAAGLALPCFYCPHGPSEGCDCRKPKPGLLTQAAEALELVGAPAVMVGDKPSDVAAGRAVGARTVLLTDARPTPADAADHIATDWAGVIRGLLSLPTEGGHDAG